MTDSASRLSVGKALGALVAVATFFALLTLGPSVWARGQVNLFMRDLTRVWTPDMLIPAPDACPPADPALTQPMAARLARAQNDDPNLLLHQGELACVQGDRARARRAWAAEAGRIPSPQVASLFAAIAAFPDNEIIDTSYQKEIGNYGSKRGAQEEKLDLLDEAVNWYEFSFAYAPSGKTAGKLAALYQKLGRDASVEDVWQRLQSAFSSDSPDYWWAVGQAAEQQKDWEAAAQAYEKAAALASASDAYKYLLREGLMWLRAREFEKSEAAYQKAIALEPKKVDGYLGVGHVYRYQKLYDQAASWYEKAIQIAPNHFAAYYYLGTMAREQGDYQDALNWFARSLARNPAHSPSYYQKALTLDAMGDRRGAIVALEEAINRSKSPQPSWQELLESWRKYPDISTDPRELDRLGREAEQAEDWEKAAAYYKLAADVARPEDAYPYLLQWARMLERMDDANEARTLYRRLTQQFPEKVAPYQALGDMARREGDLESAEKWYKQALEVASGPEAYGSLLGLGLIAQQKEAWASALDYFERARSLRDDNPIPYYYLATTLDALGQRQAALPMMEKAIALSQNPPSDWRKLLARWKTYPTNELDPAYWAAQARAAEQNQAWEQALALYEKAASLAQGEDAYPYWIRIGRLRIRQGDFEGAEEAYRQALALNDQALDPYIGIGESYRYRGDAQQAESWYRKALALAPEDWRPLYFLGLAMYKQGRYEEALAFLNQSLRKHPENAWGEYFRALSLKALGEDEAAIVSLEKAISLHSNPPENWQKLLEQWQQATQ